MPKIKKSNELWLFDCPGCGNLHYINEHWTFDGNVEAPTISPSILCRGTESPTDEEVKRIMAGEKVEPRKTVCHSFVKAGRIEFLNDCTHALAGKTVELPEI